MVSYWSAGQAGSKASMGKSSSSSFGSSITEETIEQYRNVSNSLARLIAEQDLKMRDFVLLSFSCDYGPMEIDQLASVLTASRSSTVKSINRLVKGGMVRQQTSANDSNAALISTTKLGMNFVRKIDDGS